MEGDFLRPRAQDAYFYIGDAEVPDVEKLWNRKRAWMLEEVRVEKLAWCCVELKSVAWELSLQSNVTSVPEAEWLTVGASRVVVSAGKRADSEIVIVMFE